MFLNKYFKQKNSYNKKCKDCNTLIFKNSTRCRKCATNISVKKRRSYKGIRSPAYKHGKTLKKVYCKDCGQLLSKCAYFYGYKRCLSCSQSLKVRGNKHPNYIDGRKKTLYPKEFNVKLKEEIRKRDNYICKNCGITEEEHLKLFKTKLSPHHIDYDKFNNSKSNLITLCGRCNVIANYGRDSWKEKYTKINEAVYTTEDIKGV